MSEEKSGMRKVEKKKGSLVRSPYFRAICISNNYILSWKRLLFNEKSRKGGQTTWQF